MRHHNQTSYQTLPRTSSRSRSQNHYYIQANEFQRRYQNSLMNAYRLNSSRKCPPCCNVSEERGYGSGVQERGQRMEGEGEGGRMRGGLYEQKSEYYETSYFRNQPEQQSLTNLQKSKQYLQELIEKSNINFRAHKQKTQHQIQTLQQLLHSKSIQIQQLTKEISLLKKISIQTSPSTGQNIAYSKQNNEILVDIQNNQKTIKELQRKCSRYREENSYFREDIDIKNKEIQQLKEKFRMKEGNDFGVRKQLERENNDLRQEKRIIIEKIGWCQRVLAEKESKIREMQRTFEKDQQKIRKLEAEIDILRNSFTQSKSQSTQIQHRYLQQLRSFQIHFTLQKQKSRQKDMQIQQLISKINCIQSELDFFKEKFTNLLFEIEREQRQSQVMFEHATSLKEEGMKIFDERQGIRQSEIIESMHRNSMGNGGGYGQNRLMAESLGIASLNRMGLGKDTVLQSLSQRHFVREYGQMAESNVDLIHKFPSLMSMSISPIRTKE